MGECRGRERGWIGLFRVWWWMDVRASRDKRWVDLLDGSGLVMGMEGGSEGEGMKER